MADLEIPSSGEAFADRIDKVKQRVSTEIPGICNRCTLSHIYRTPRMNEPTVICSERTGNYRVPIDVMECNQFRQMGQLSIWELAKLAIDVDITTKHTPGFHNK